MYLVLQSKIVVSFIKDIVSKIFVFLGIIFIVVIVTTIGNVYKCLLGLPSSESELTVPFKTVY